MLPFDLPWQLLGGPPGMGDFVDSHTGPGRSASPSGSGTPAAAFNAGRPPSGFNWNRTSGSPGVWPDLPLLSPFIQLVTNGAPRLKNAGVAPGAFEKDAFRQEIADAVAEQYRKAKWLLPMQVTYQAWHLLAMLRLHALTAWCGAGE